MRVISVFLLLIFTLSFEVHCSIIYNCLHGINGINPLIAWKLWRTFVVLRMLYGIEALKITTTDIYKLEQFQKKTLKLSQIWWADGNSYESKITFTATNQLLQSQSLIANCRKASWYSDTWKYKQPNVCWSSVRDNKRDVKQGVIKSRVLTVHMQSINHISANRVNIFPVLRANQITCTAVNYQL
jgi:hypothetical protein